jgi:phosphopantothenoylcysteine decarboxylase / phosphopantothenate---cysteine ligase
MKILLAITGSIASYKSIELARLFIKDGHDVKCIVSKGAEEFIKPELLSYLGAISVYTSGDDFNLSKYDNSTSNVLHIDLTNWCDLYVIAPLSANTMAKLAHGQCDDLLSSVFLATTDKPIVIAPAMNTKMYNNPITQKNIEILKELENVSYVAPESGVLACGDVGIGKFPKIEKIKALIEVTPLQSNITPQNVLISTGASISPIDPVRYLTNASSGKTGLMLAKEFLRNGDFVTVVAGQVIPEELKYLVGFSNFKLIQSTTTSKLKDIIINEFNLCDIYISAAAFCDIEFTLKNKKIKKDQFTGNLEYTSAPDILTQVLQLKRVNQKVIGFAAETSADETIFLKKWEQKKVDILIGNIVESGLGDKEALGFGTNSGDYFFIQDGQVVETEHLTKRQLAQKIIRISNEHYSN